MQISGIFIYPVKSLRGIALPAAKLEKRGLQYDRRWMLIDPDGVFISQREVPAMALLNTAITDTHLVISHSHEARSPLSVPLQASADAERLTVQIWNDTCPALAVSTYADEWLSETLQTPCRLVYMPDDSVRPTDPDFNPGNDMVSFADGYPILIIGEASLADLNQKLENPLPMNRFRPNLVFNDGSPFAEDQWKNFQIGDLQFRGIKPCGRCAITTINQENAERGSEPLKTLATYRLDGKKILFGMNVCWDEVAMNSPIVKIGDSIVIKF